MCKGCEYALASNAFSEYNVQQWKGKKNKALSLLPSSGCINFGFAKSHIRQYSSSLRVLLK